MIRSTFALSSAFAALLAFGAAPASAQSDPAVDLMLQAVAAGLPASAAPQLVQNADVCASRGGQMLATTSGAQVCVGGIAAPGSVSDLPRVSVPGIEAVRVESAALPGQGTAQQPVAFTAVPAPQGFVPSAQPYVAPLPAQFAAPAPVAIPAPAPLQQYAAPAPVAAPAPLLPASSTTQVFESFSAPVAAPAPAPLLPAAASSTTTVTTTTYGSTVPYVASSGLTGSDGFVTLNIQEDPAAAAACAQQGGVSAYAMNGRYLCLTGDIYRSLPLPTQQILPATVGTTTFAPVQ